MNTIKERLGIVTIVVMLLLATSAVVIVAATAGSGGSFQATDGVNFASGNVTMKVVDSTHEITGVTFGTNSVRMQNQNVTIHGNGTVAANWNLINGTWSNVTTMTVGSNDVPLWIDVDNRNVQYGFEGINSVVGFNFTNATPNDLTTDFWMRSNGASTLYINGLNATGGESYGLIKNDGTDIGISVAIVNSTAAGGLKFENIPALTSNTPIKIESLGSLYIREELESLNHALVQPVEVEVIFFEATESSPLVVKKTTTNGIVNLTGLPTVGTEPFAVSIKADNGYYNRTVLLSSLAEQRDIFLLNKSAEDSTGPGVNKVVFSVVDYTGFFSSNDTSIFIQKPINQTVYAGSGGWSFMNIAGDYLAGSGLVYNFTGIHDDRYKILVVDGSHSKVLGAFVPTYDGFVELQIDTLEFSAVDKDASFWFNVTYDDTLNVVRLQYYDTNATSSSTGLIWNVTNAYPPPADLIYEGTGCLTHCSSFSDTTGALNATSFNQTLKVQFSVLRGSGNYAERIGGVDLVNAHNSPYLDNALAALNLDRTWSDAIGLILIILVAAATSAVSSTAMSGFIIAFFGSVLYLIGMLPLSVTGGGIAIGWLISAAYYLTERKKGGAS